VAGVLFNLSKTVLIQYTAGNVASSYTIPNGVTTIGADAFDRQSPYSIMIPNTVTSIGAGAFFLCPFTSFTIPNSVTSLGNGVFDEDNIMKNVTIGSGISDLPAYTFSACVDLTNVYFKGNAPTAVGGDAFFGMGNATPIICGHERLVPIF